MKKFRKVVVLGVLILSLIGLFSQNSRSQCENQQYIANTDAYDDRDIEYV